MADGMNHVRAIRLAEIMQDFRNIQHYIAQIHVAPSPEDFYAEGYVLLRQCISDSQAILRAPFNTSPPAPEGDPEAQKEQLQRILLDASSRRFEAQRIYLRVTAAVRWMNSRNSILVEQWPAPAQSSALQQIDMVLRSELSAITDQNVVDHLRMHDQRLGHWTQEDPELNEMLFWITSTRYPILPRATTA